MAKTFDELFDEAYELVQRANELLAERIRLKQKALQLRADYQSDIDDLKEEADNLAQEFKRLFQESQEAYSNRQGALAKSLAAQGKAKQSECEDLNRQVKGKIEEMKRRVNGLYQQADEKQEEAVALIQSAEAIEDELKRQSKTAWATFVAKRSQRGYQEDLYSGFEGRDEHLHEFYSLDERGIHRGTVRTIEPKKGGVGRSHPPR